MEKHGELPRKAADAHPRPHPGRLCRRSSPAPIPGATPAAKGRAAHTQQPRGANCFSHTAGGAAETVRGHAVGQNGDRGRPLPFDGLSEGSMCSFPTTDPIYAHSARGSTSHRQPRRQRPGNKWANRARWKRQSAAGDEADLTRRQSR